MRDRLSLYGEKDVWRREENPEQGQGKKEEGFAEDQSDCSFKAVEPEEDNRQESTLRREEETFIATCP